MKYILLSLFLNYILANPDGAPICTADVNAVNSAMGTTTGSGYSLSAPGSVAPGGKINLSVNGGSYKGLLLYCTPKGDDSQRVGKFGNLPANFKASTACSYFPASSVITHSNPNSKQGVSFEWTADSTVSGDVSCTGLVVTTSNTAQQLPAVTVKVGAASASTPPPSGAIQAASVKPTAKPAAKPVAKAPPPLVANAAAANAPFKMSPSPCTAELKPTLQPTYGNTSAPVAAAAAANTPPTYGNSSAPSVASASAPVSPNVASAPALGDNGSNSTTTSTSGARGIHSVSLLAMVAPLFYFVC